MRESHARCVRLGMSAVTGKLVHGYGYGYGYLVTDTDRIRIPKSDIRAPLIGTTLKQIINMTTDSQIIEWLEAGMDVSSYEAGKNCRWRF